MKAASPQCRNRLTLLLLPLSVVLIVVGWTAGSRPASAKTEGGILPAGTAPAALTAQTGIASYYGERYQGRKTANGEIFDMNKLTAAHRSLPFGSAVRVTNLANDRSVLVRINDRGPFVGGRIIDLSLEAAKQLDMIEAGVTQVRVEEIPPDGRTDAGIPSRPNGRHLALLVPGDQLKPAGGKSVSAIH
jgi:rare lipoprotein A